MVAQPGAQGLNVINMDGVALPTEPPHPDATRRFFEYAGPAEGIDRFNRIKKSIPPRTDVSLDGYPPFVREQAEGFRNADGYLPSMAHGLAVPPDELEVCFADFIASRDVAATTDDLVSVFNTVS